MVWQQHASVESPQPGRDPPRHPMLSLSPGCANRSAAAPFLYRDIHAPVDLLPQLAASRHWDRELILLTSNWAQYDLAVNLIATLQRLGLHHHLLIGDNEQLVRHAQARGAIPAVWSSMLEQYVKPVRGDDERCPLDCGNEPPPGSFGLQRSSPPAQRRPRSPEMEACLSLQVRHCLPGAASFYRVDAVRRLWLLRFIYTERLVGLGYNVLLLDSDSIVLADPYPHIRRHLAEYALLCLSDVTAWPHMMVNGGTWYFQNVLRGGRVHQMLQSFRRRVFLLFDGYPQRKHTEKRPSGEKGKDWLLFDQTIMNMALLSAAVGKELTLHQNQPDHLDHLRLLSTAAPYTLTLAERRAIDWTSVCCADSPTSLGHPPFIGGSARPGSSGAARRNPYEATKEWREGESHLPYGRTYPLRVLSLAALPPLKPEKVAKAPPWLFSAESDIHPQYGRTVASHWGAWPPPAAIVHFVCSSWPGSDGRRAAMRLWGFWADADIWEELGREMQWQEARRLRGLIAFVAPVPV